MKCEGGCVSCSFAMSKRAHLAAVIECIMKPVRDAQQAGGAYFTTRAGDIVRVMPIVSAVVRSLLPPPLFLPLPPPSRPLSLVLLSSHPCLPHSFLVCGSIHLFAVWRLSSDE